MRWRSTASAGGAGPLCGPRALTAAQRYIVAREGLGSTARRGRGGGGVVVRGTVTARGAREWLHRLASHGAGRVGNEALNGADDTNTCRRHAPGLPAVQPPPPVPGRMTRRSGFEAPPPRWRQTTAARVGATSRSPSRTLRRTEGEMAIRPLEKRVATAGLRAESRATS